MASAKLTQENAVLLLETLFIKERLDWDKWDLRQMKANVTLMKKITDCASWKKSEEQLSSMLSQTLDELITIIQEKDSTRVIAGHTHVEQALRNVLNSTFAL